MAALPAEQQIEAVAKKLQELNPGFDGTITDWTPKGASIEHGVVTKFGFATDDVTDISPVRALPELKVLRCAGSAIGNGNLSNLSPLAGMKLTSLDCYLNPTLADLSVLQGMPLTNLQCYGTQVSDLSPLPGMPLTLLNIIGTQVSDLSPLRGIPLEKLWCCFATGVRSVAAKQQSDAPAA